MGEIAAIYTRVSTEEQARGGVSLAAQADRARKYCALKDYEPRHVLVDDGVSSGIPLTKRPAGHELQEAVSQGEVRHIVAYSLSRLFRDNEEALRISREWDAAGVTLHLLDLGGQALDTSTPLGRFFFSIMAAASELERNMLRERVTVAMRHIVEQQQRFVAGDVYGYRPLPDKGGIEPHPDEAPIVERLFREYHSGGSLAGIVQSLNADGVPTKHGRRWDTAQASKILGNPVYIGAIRWAGEEFPGCHEPIISKRLWNLVQTRREARSTNHGKRFKHFSTLFRCGHCGSTMRALPPGRRPMSEGDGVLVCKDRLSLPAAKRHAGIYNAEAKLMAVVWRHTEIILSGGYVQRGIEEAQRRQAEDRGQHRELRAQLAEVRAQISVNLDAARRGSLPPAMLDAENAPLVAQLAELEETLEALEPPDLSGWEAVAAMDAGEVLQTYRSRRSLEDQLRLLMGLYERVDVFRGEVTFHHQGGFLDPATRPLPGYYSEARGITGLGF